MPKPPLSANEPERLAALARYSILDTPPEPAFDDITRLVGRICQAPIALVTLIDGDRQWFKSRVGFKINQLPRDLAFCVHTIQQNGILVVADALADSRFANNPLVTDSPKIRFYAGAPLLTPDGYGIGTLCVFDLAPREMTPQQADALRTLSHQVMNLLELRYKSGALADAVSAREQAEAQTQEIEETLVARQHTLEEEKNKAEEALLAQLRKFEAEKSKAEETLLAHKQLLDEKIKAEEALLDRQRRLEEEYRAERKRAEDALLQSEARARVLLDAIPDLVFRLSADGKFVDFVANARELFVPPEQFLGRPYREVMPPHVSSLTEEAIARARETDSVQTFEYELPRPDGQTGYYEARLSVDSDSNVLVMVRNITERRKTEDALRESQERFRQLAETIHQVFWITSADQTQVIYASRAYEEIWGRACQSLYDDPRSFLDAIHPDDHDRIVAAQPRRTQGDYDVTYRIVRPDGSLRWIRSIAFPVRDADGNIYRVAGISEDITEQKRSEMALQAQKQLFENLVAVARATAERPTLEATLQNALDVSVALTGAARGSLFLLDAAGEVTHSILSGSGEFTSSRRDLVELVMKSGLAGWVADNRQATLIDDTAVDQRWLGPPDKEYTTRSVLAVPILHGEALVGIMTLLHAEPGRFTPDHLSLMQAAADQMALTLRNAQIFDQARRQAEEMYMLNYITRAALEASDFNEMLQVLADRMGGVLGADGSYLALWDEAGQRTLPAAASGNLSEAYRSLSIEPGEITMTASVLAAGRALVAEDALDSPYLSRRIAEQFPARSLLGLPLVARGQKLGAALIAFNTTHHFTSAEIALGEQAARQIALAISSAMLYRTIAEERVRLQALIESSRDGVVLIGMNRRVLVINAPAMRLLGIPGKPEDWIGRSLGEALRALARHAPQVVKATLSEARRIRRGDEPPAEGEYEVQSRVIYWLDLPVVANGAALGRLLVLRDVTEERMLEKMRDDLTYMMVHDLRSPLTAIIGAADLLKEMEHAEVSKEREIIALVRDGAEHMQNLVGAILDVSQLESRQMPVERAPVQLSVLVAEVLQLQLSLSEQKQISFENNVSADLPPAWADARLVERVLQNLIGNALKYTPAGGAIRIAAQQTSSTPPMLSVSVSDTGSGIPAEIQGRLFQKFVTGEQKGHGSGLGLAFCRLAVEAHGGRIWAESDSGSGAAFTFTLPLYQPGN